ncbi:hypothetical protein GKR71_18950 [Providencia sp. wls1922]|uniref:hypothetical protein n=1 Tax=Providencia sp. wls1922 TaxID=2675152 RepID=UPI0012B5086D|nr:hypothetical protein [Providencia sp. wls1922]MTC47893.1 hypothetical protein [Providencia sp. wls1922]
MYKNKIKLLFFGITFGFMGLLSFLFSYFLYDGYYNVKLNIVTFTSLAVSFVTLTLAYLQSGSEANEMSKTMSRDISYIYRKLHNEVTELKKTIGNKEVAGELNSEEKDFIINEIIRKNGTETIREIFNNESNLLSQNIKENLIFDKVIESSNNIIQRLKREIEDLRLRANMNLAIGMAITAGGLYLLWSTVSIIDSSELLKQLASEGDDTNTKFLKNLILPIVPRVLLIIFIEVFAYFFLQLYKSGLADIKYFQNELTNIESKLSAVEFSYITNNQDGLKVSIESLSKTERNFILDKGKTTIELEKAKADTELSRSIIKIIPNILGKSRR